MISVKVNEGFARFLTKWRDQGNSRVTKGE